MNSNLYINEFCGTCVHSEVCIHLWNEENLNAKSVAVGAALQMPDPFKIKLFCSKFKSRS